MAVCSNPHRSGLISLIPARCRQQRINFAEVALGGTAIVEEHVSARSNDSPSFTALEWLTQQRANPAEVDKPIRNLEVAAKVIHF